VTVTSMVSSFPRLYEGVQQDSITGATAATVGQVFELPADWNGLPTVIDWEIIFPGSAPASLSAQLEGSDDSSFPSASTFILDGPYTTTTSTVRFVVNKPKRFIRANLTAIGSNSVTVRLKNSGKQ
jgi:hypothetical protein